ncbi:threonine-phosphate decarboxylase CobD [Algibacillus agarilyticus]|uniref:threonine-phosphate decarboxylase CobD n=1 Tax=Algibacillus agarilyticus TaxID=2234133 RepID=UPI000DCF674B|nr:threonine-phosphate decarboxylase CobD [Algibacillus agarilyticus]
MALIHGGQLYAIAKQYHSSPESWIDLSTGIAPLSYPIPPIHSALWQQLPQPSDALIQAAKAYYQCDQVLVSNGSQSIIKQLPTLWLTQQPKATTVYLPTRGYKEHAHAWIKAGFNVNWYTDELPNVERLVVNCVLVVINPNNPTGQLYTRQTLQTYQTAIESLQGLLIIDEAFMDVISPNQSLAQTPSNNTLILRSFGKFFGLAGIRIGFAIAGKTWLNHLQNELGPWQVNGPAQYIAEVALNDDAWQQRQIQTLTRQQKDLQQVLLAQLKPIIKSIKGTLLFQTVTLNNKIKAADLYHALCEQQVYVRLTDEQDALRFGMLTTAQLPRFERALALALNQLT